MKRLLYFSFCFLSSLTTRSQNEGDLVFQTPVVHDIYLTFQQVNYWDSLLQGYAGDYYIRGNIEINGTQLPDCGIKFKGNSSYNNPSDKKSFKLDFNEFVSGQKYDGLKKLNLNNCFKDPSFLREKLMLDFLGHYGVPAPRCSYAKVYINGTYWGLYTVVEEVNSKFLDQRFNDDRGNLFKGDPNGDLKWLGSTLSNYYPKYELKTNEILNDWTDLVFFIDKLNNTPLQNLEDTMRYYFNLDDYLKTWAVHLLFSNLDSYLGSGHNYYLYHDSLSSKWQFITWDVNEAFGNFNMGMSVSQLENLSLAFTPSPSGNRPLHERLLQLPSVKQDLADILCGMVNYDFSIWGMEARIDSLVNAIRPHVYADTKKFYTNQQFEDNINMNVTGTGPGGGTLPGIKSFLMNRRTAIVNELNSYACISGTNEIVSSNKFIIYPQPANDVIFIGNENPGEKFSLNIFALDGRKIFSVLSDMNEPIDISSLSDGAYFILISDENNNPISTNKLLITKH